MDCDVVVIGAGAGGLAAGATLASSGFETIVLEQSDRVGGCASSFENSGFCFDVGACIVELPRFHDWFYRRVGLDRRDYVTLLQNEPMYELLDVLSGERFTVPTSLEGTAQIIARHSKRDARAFLDFMKKEGKILDRFCDILFTTPQGRLRDLARVFAKYPRILSNMGLVINPYKKLVGDLFEHEFTRKLMANYSVIGGLPPSRQSGMMMWLCYAEHEGMYYPRGGMGAVPRGMAKALVDLGGEIRLNNKVSRVLLDRKKARGVLLSDGTTITSRAVVSNANALVLYRDMVGAENLPTAVIKGLESYDYSPSCAVGYLGLDCRPPMEAQHIFTMASPGLIESFFADVYQRDFAVPESVGLVSSTTLTDPSLAPDGHHTLSFVTIAPYRPAGATWGETKWEYLDRGINMIDSLIAPGIKDHVVFKTIATPEDYEKRLGIPNGSIYAFSMSLLSQMVFRPSNRSRCIKNLYLCGASTHLGSVPGAVCSGTFTGELAANDLDRRWRP